MRINTDPKKIEEVLTRGVNQIVRRDNLIKKLESGKQLRVKHGVDPTSKDLHLGYAVVYLKLKALQEMGHKIVFLIGDFTGRFGDPTQKLEARRLRTKKEVRAMAKDYLSQVGKILDLKKLEVRYNSEWYDKMSAEDLLRLMSHFSHQRIIERDMFQDRIKKGTDIRFHEPVYPVLQAYDSVILKSDLTVCGNDQLFNESKARDLQRDFNQDPQDIITMKLLVGVDGKEKMSQSIGNYIGITENPKEQFGKIMSIPDDLIGSYFELLTEISMPKIDPRDAKVLLAKKIITVCHNQKAAEAAEKEFNTVFREGGLPEEIPGIGIKEKLLSILDLLVEAGLTESKSEAKRLIEQGGVKIDDEVQNDWQKIVEIKKGQVLQVGKRKFAKII